MYHDVCGTVPTATQNLLRGRTIRNNTQSAGLVLIHSVTDHDCACESAGQNGITIDAPCPIAIKWMKKNRHEQNERAEWWKLNKALTDKAKSGRIKKGMYVLCSSFILIMNTYTNSVVLDHLLPTMGLSTENTNVILCWQLMTHYYYIAIPFSP